MNGKHKLHQAIFQDTLFPELEALTLGKADRNEILKDKIACRYYYYARHCRMLYKDCLQQLELEFDKAERTLVEAHLDQRSGFIQRLNDDNVMPAELKKRYPWYDWSYRPR